MGAKPFFSAENPGKIAVLYVEDDYANQQVMDMALTSDPGITVWTASSGEDALEILEEEETLPDVVLMDNQLSSETGSEVCPPERVWRLQCHW